MIMSSKEKARYWLLTIPEEKYDGKSMPEGVKYLRGQLEEGTTTGYRHWQLVAHYGTQVRRSSVIKSFGQYHCEPTRSAAAESYCFKEETSVEGSRFELGERSFNRNNAKDWESIRDAARTGRLDDIPADVFVRNYMSLRRITVDYAQPVGVEREIKVYWGATGVGKSKRAWEEAGIQAYPKDPLSKFWDGYRGQEHVVIDEFRGGISIEHVLRWFDRYPVIVDVKGSSVVLKAKTIWITSNLSPQCWYPTLDSLTQMALLRRLNVINIV